MILDFYVMVNLQLINIENLNITNSELNESSYNKKIPFKENNFERIIDIIAKINNNKNNYKNNYTISQSEESYKNFKNSLTFNSEINEKKENLQMISNPSNKKYPQRLLELELNNDKNKNEIKFYSNHKFKKINYFTIDEDLLIKKLSFENKDEKEIDENDIFKENINNNKKINERSTIDNNIENYIPNCNGNKRKSNKGNYFIFKKHFIFKNYLEKMPLIGISDFFTKIQMKNINAYSEQKSKSLIYTNKFLSEEIILTEIDQKFNKYNEELLNDYNIDSLNNEKQISEFNLNKSINDINKPKPAIKNKEESNIVKKDQTKNEKNLTTDRFDRKINKNNQDAQTNKFSSNINLNSNKKTKSKQKHSSKIKKNSFKDIFNNKIKKKNLNIEFSNINRNITNNQIPKNPSFISQSECNSESNLNKLLDKFNKNYDRNSICIPESNFADKLQNIIDPNESTTTGNFNITREKLKEYSASYVHQSIKNEQKFNKESTNEICNFIQ